MHKGAQNIFHGVDCLWQESMSLHIKHHEELILDALDAFFPSHV